MHGVPVSKLVDRETRRSAVPCDGCTLCCRTLIVPLAEEEFESYDWAWIEKDGKRLGRALKRRPDGACVYLGDRGCTIHGHAPHVCQRFDCRDLVVKWNRNERRHKINSGQLPKSLFVKGREMLEKMK
jgi:hypothetical protein